MLCESIKHHLPPPIFKNVKEHKVLTFSPSLQSDLTQMR